MKLSEIRSNPPGITALTPSDDLELPAPVGDFVAGDRAKFHITPSAQITLTMAAGIKIPSDSTFAGKVLTADKLYIVQLEYSGTAWLLTSLVGGYN